MSAPTARMVFWFAGFVLIVVAAGIAIHGGVESDRRLSDFCSSVLPGHRLEDVRVLAAARRYTVLASAFVSPHQATEVFEARLLWPKSWCRLDHDGSFVTARTFNPWYE